MAVFPLASVTFTRFISLSQSIDVTSPIASVIVIGFPSAFTCISVVCPIASVEQVVLFPLLYTKEYIVKLSRYESSDLLYKDLPIFSTLPSVSYEKRTVLSTRSTAL